MQSPQHSAITTPPQHKGVTLSQPSEHHDIIILQTTREYQLAPESRSPSVALVC